MSGGGGGVHLCTFSRKKKKSFKKPLLFHPIFTQSCSFCCPCAWSPSRAHPAGTVSTLTAPSETELPNSRTHSIWLLLLPFFQKFIVLSHLLMFLLPLSLKSSYSLLFFFCYHDGIQGRSRKWTFTYALISLILRDFMLRRNLNFTLITEVLEIGILSSKLLGLPWWSSG